ncbi:MAG: tetratricopeptide repeat protein [Bacteroidota bacterium]
MKSKIISLLLLLLLTQVSKAQSIEKLFENEEFESVIKYAEKADELNGEELYYVGFSFFMLDDDANAIKMYDKAIGKGLDDDYIYLQKGLSLRYTNQNVEAIRNFEIAVEKNPESQENHTELGVSYYLKESYDTALMHLQTARKLPYEIGDSYLLIPNIYHIKEDFERALKEYRISAELIDKEDLFYADILENIGLLEYTVFNNYDKSVSAYQKVLELNPENYDFYPKLIKSYYANEDFEKGDSLINILKVEYDNGNLSESFRKYGRVSIAEFKWNSQVVIVFKYFEEPKEMLDLMYKIILISEDGQTVERTLMTEKTIQLEDDGPKHLLCERGEENGLNVHYTYPYGWSTDTIEFNSLKEAVIAVLNDELKPSASSSFSLSEKEAKPKKRKKRKNKKKKKAGKS